MARFTAIEIKQWNVSGGKSWKPTRPLNYKFDGVTRRVKLAFGVLVGRYDALDWEQGGQDE